MIRSDIKTELPGAVIAGGVLGAVYGVAKSTGPCGREVLRTVGNSTQGDWMFLSCVTERCITPILYGAAIFSAVTLVAHVADRVLPAKKN